METVNTMTEEDIKKYIDSALTTGLRSGLEQFSKHFTEQMSPVLDRLTQFEEVLTEPQAAPASAPDEASTALLERIAKMEQAEQKRTAELAQAKFDQALTSNLAKHSPLHADVVKELLGTRLAGKATEKNGQWYLPNGAKLEEEINGFFASDVGSHFLPNTAGASLGVGKETKSHPTPLKKSEVTSEQMLAETFGL